MDWTGLHWTWTALKSSWVQMDFSVHSNWTGLGVRSSPVQSSPVYEIWVARLSEWLGPVSPVESTGVRVESERKGWGREKSSASFGLGDVKPGSKLKFGLGWRHMITSHPGNIPGGTPITAPCMLELQIKYLRLKAVAWHGNTSPLWVWNIL